VEFNTYDLYLNQVKEDDVFNSNEYKYLKENNIDTAEIEGIDKDPDAGEIKFDKDQKISDEDNKLLLKDVTDFMLDIPRDTLISILRGGTNGFQFVNNFAGAIGLTEELFGPDATDQLNQKFDKIKSDLDNAQEDSPFVTKMIAMAGQDAMYTYPIYKKLQKAGFPKMWRLPLSFALGGALAFDKKESFFVDSNSMRNLKAYIGIAEDTPIEEMYDKTVQAIEFGAFGKIFDDVLGMTKGIKKMNKDRIKQADIAVGGSAATAGVVEQFTDDDPNQATNEMMPNPEAIEEKKNPNFNEEEIIPGTVNEYGFEKTSSLVPVFKSVLKETAKKLPNKGSGEQILNTLKNTPGLKQQELKWSGLDDFLKDKKTATKDEVKEFLNLNSLDIEEVRFGGASSTMPEGLTARKREFEAAWLENEMKVLNSSDPSIAPENRLPNRPFSEQERAGLLDNNLNYDVYKLFNETDGKEITIDFNALNTYFGEEIFSGKIKPNEIFSGPEAKYTMSDLEIEKFKIEDKVRALKSEGNQPKFGDSSYTAPGGEDYTELVFKIKRGGMDVGIPTEKTSPLPGGKTFRTRDFVPYKNPSHMNVKSEIAHVRFKTRYMEDPTMPSENFKVLTVEEMQSDFATAVRKSKKNELQELESADGFRVGDMARELGMRDFTLLEAEDAIKKSILKKNTDFPFKNTWYELTTKRLIRYAADNGFDAVAIPKGIVSARRYGEDITSGIKSVNVSKNSKGNVYVFFKDSKNEPITGHVYSKDGSNLTKTFDELKKEVGEKVYKQIDEFNPKNAEDKTDFALEKEIAIGSGLGKHQLYDKTIPSFMKKYGKKWNAKVYDDEISTSGSINMNIEQPGFNKEIKMPVTIIQLTPEMKQSVQKDGQALFNIFGIGSGAAIGSNAILDSDRNNTISNLTEN